MRFDPARPGATWRSSTLASQSNRRAWLHRKSGRAAGGHAGGGRQAAAHGNRPHKSGWALILPGRREDMGGLGCRTRPSRGAAVALGLVGLPRPDLSLLIAFFPRTT